MKTQEALNIRDALITLSKALDMDIQKVASYVCLFDDKRYAVLKEASKIWNEFHDASIVERGKMMGIKITEYEPGDHK
jgi:hypothetical protein